MFYKDSLCGKIMNQQHLVPGRCRSHSSSSVGAERCSASGCQEEEMPKWDSITPTIRNNLHWLLVRHRVDFKIWLLVYKCLHQLVAPYLVSMISPVSAVSTRRHLRSAGQGDLVVLRTRTAGFSPRSLSVAGPLAWNSLPPEIKTTSLTLRWTVLWPAENWNVSSCSCNASAQPS